MGAKGDAAKTRIMDISQKIFVEKGFSTVTMQDICREAELSRGGLYRYFASTDEIFGAIIEREQKNAFKYFEMAKDSNISPKAILSFFLKYRINELIHSDIAFDNAVSDFAINSELGKKILKNRAETSIDILSEIIETGCLTGAFKCDNPKAAATHILWLLEGMGKHSALVQITEEDVEAQIRYIDCLLGISSSDDENGKPQSEIMTEQYKALSDRTLLLESLSANVPGGYHRCSDAEGFPLVFLSQSFLEVVGWTREEIKEELDNKYINIVAPEDREFFLGYEEQLVREGRVDLTYRIVRKDGSRRWIQDATVMMEKNNEIYYQCTLSDITDYVERLNEEKARAEASSLAKSTFLFNASHDIRTPMNAVLGFANIIENNADNEQIVRDSVDKIIQSGNILMTLLNDVLELSRIEQGKEEVNEQPLDMEEHAQNLVEMFASEMSNAGVNFYMENDIKHRHVLGDDLKLTRIAMNLLSNAKKFTPKGGNVTFGIRETDYDGECANYCLFVRDTGIGMSKEFQKHAFKQFERANSYTESGISGSGLGLAIIKKLCELMGGTCTIDSELGKGSEFTVIVPLKIAKDIVYIQNIEDTENMNFSGKRVLLVEDNEFNREIARYALEGMDLVVEEAENGSVAVNMLLKAEAGYYDLVLMDVQMPVMDGYTATQEIRRIENKEIASIPIIAMTANAFQEDKDKCLNVGMNGHIAKPLDLNILIDVLRSQC